MDSEAANDSLLVVLGATGNQGGAVLRHFAGLRGRNAMKLRGVTRDTLSDAARELAALGVEMWKADLNDVESLKNSFEGATYIFATTDSNHLIRHAIDNADILTEGETPGSYAERIEVSQGDNIAKAAGSTRSLRRIVWSGLPSPKKWSSGRCTKVTMFDAKENIADVLAAEPGLKGKLSIVLVGFYATNAIAVPDLYAPSKDDGTYELALPMSGDLPIPMADLDADMGRWAQALFGKEPGTVLVGATALLSWKQWLEMWARHAGVRARYRRTTASEYGARLTGLSDAVAEEFEFIEELGFTGGDPRVVYPGEFMNETISSGLSKIEDQIRLCDWSSIL